MISDLLNLVPPPASPTGVASQDHWEFAERILCVRFPRDIKDLNRIYGTGWFDDFIGILSPNEKHKPFSLLEYKTETQMIMEGLAARYPELSVAKQCLRLIPIGWTRNGDELFYLIAAEQSEWEIVIAESRSFDGTRYCLSLSSFLANVISKRLNCPQFPNQFPSVNPTFHVELENEKETVKRSQSAN